MLQQKMIEENRRELVHLKAELYHLFITFSPGLLTDNEAEILFLLSRDPDIQKMLKGG